MDYEQKYLEIKNHLNELESEKEYTEYLFSVDKYLSEDDNLPMSIQFTLNYLAGIIAMKMDDFDMAIPYLMKTYYQFQRIEGLVLVVSYFYEIERHLLAYSLSMVSIMTKYIDDIGCNDLVYDFQRYLLHAKICLKVAKFEEGIDVLKKSMEYLNKNTDMIGYKEYIVETKELFDELNDKLTENK